MSAGITGTYDGEGANVTAANAVAATADVAASSIANAKGQGRTAFVTVDRRKRLRVSSESARSSTAINVGGGDQILSVCARGVYVSGGGNIVGRLADDAADVTFTGLSAGQWYPFAFALIRQTGTTATGTLLF